MKKLKDFFNNGYTLIALAFVLFWIGNMFAAPLPLEHKMLVATEKIKDGVFEKSVVFILHHNRMGAYGLIVNKGDVGGPVEPERIVDLKNETQLVRHGHAGWSRGQLEGEIKQGRWKVIDYDQDLLHEKGAWQQALQKPDAKLD